MVMKVAHTMSISPASSVYDLWTGTYTLNEFDTDALTIATGTKTYKSSVVDNWSSYQISAVSYSFINAITVLFTLVSLFSSALIFLVLALFFFTMYISEVIISLTNSWTDYQKRNLRTFMFNLYLKNTVHVYEFLHTYNLVF